MGKKINFFRFVIARFFLFTLGIRIGFWRKRVEAFWTKSDNAKNKERDLMLWEVKPKDSERNPVTSLDQLSISPILSKQRVTHNSSSTKNWLRKLFLFNRATAGTTGTPLSIELNRSELGRMLGVRDYCFSYYGIRVGDREARIWARGEGGIKTFIKNFILNRKIFYPLGSDSKFVVEAMLKWKPQYIYGYSSLILEASQIVESNNLSVPAIQCVICTAETILPTQKKYIESVFGCPVVEEYGSTEFDVVAFECKQKHLHLVNPWYVVEEACGEIVVSDIARESQHLIRFNISDDVVLKELACREIGSSWVVDELKGRSVDQFAYFDSGVKIHAVEFARIIERFLAKNNECFQFSVRQKSFTDFEVSVFPYPNKGLKKLEVYMAHELKVKTGKTVNVVAMTGLGRELGEKYTYFFSDMA